MAAVGEQGLGGERRRREEKRRGEGGGLCRKGEERPLLHLPCVFLRPWTHMYVQHRAAGS